MNLTAENFLRLAEQVGTVASVDPYRFGENLRARDYTVSILGESGATASFKACERGVFSPDEGAKTAFIDGMRAVDALLSVGTPPKELQAALVQVTGQKIKIGTLIARTAQMDANVISAGQPTVAAPAITA